MVSAIGDLVIGPRESRTAAVISWVTLICFAFGVFVCSVAFFSRYHCRLLSMQLQGGSRLEITQSGSALWFGIVRDVATSGPKPLQSRKKVLGIEIGRNTWGVSHPQSAPWVTTQRYVEFIAIPLWMWFLLTIPCVAIRIRWIHQRARHNAPATVPRCSRCGYELRGNRSGTCPECGRAVDPPVADSMKSATRESS